MITVTHTFTKQNTDIQYIFANDAKFNDLVYGLMTSSDGFITIKLDWSDDHTTKTIIQYWESMSDYQNYLDVNASSMIKINARNQKLIDDYQLTITREVKEL